MRTRGWLVSIIGGLVLIALDPSVAAPVEIPPLRPTTTPDFTADLVLSLDADGRPAMAVSIAIPYQSLSWIRLPPPHPAGRHGAGVEISVSFQPEQSGRLAGDAWERRLVVGSFEGTLTRTSLIERRSFEIPPGRYQVSVRVRDLNADIESSAEHEISVPDVSRVPVGFADLEMGVADSAGTFRAIPARLYGSDVQWLAARATLFDRRPGPWPRSYKFRHRITDEVGAQLLEGTNDVTLSRSADPVIIRPAPADLFVGRYSLEVELAEGRSRWRVDRSFEVEESGPPRGAAFDRLLEPLSYIAPPDEIRRLQDSPEAQRAAEWQAFWDRRDPTPDTPRNEALIEFIRRVRHSERHFQGYGPGWRSDMGRIYIRHGPPDQIESRAASTDTPQLEIWYYQSPLRTFVFADREGFGRYTLVSPE